MFRQKSDLAAMEGKRLGLDGIMTALSFALLFVIVVIPIFMIIYNAFFYEGKFDLTLFTSVIFDPENLKAMGNTIIIAVAVTIFGTIMGLFYAWLLGRSDIPAKGFMRALFVGFAFFRAGRLYKPLADVNFSFKNCPDKYK